MGYDTTIDAGQNYLVERFYQQIAFAQSLENSSNRLVGDSISSASLFSRVLQEISMYPTLFNQAQAANHGTTKSKWQSVAGV